MCSLELLCTHDEGFRPQFEMVGFQVDTVKQRYTETKGGILSVRINGLFVLSGLNLEKMKELGTRKTVRKNKLSVSSGCP